MPRPLSLPPPPKKCRSTYVAVRDSSGEIDWENTRGTKPWACTISEHAHYAAPETLQCLHPDCIGRLISSLTGRAKSLVTAIKANTRKNGMTWEEVCNEVSLELLDMYHTKDIPISAAQGVLYTAVQSFKYKLFREKARFATKTPLPDNYDELDELLQESKQLFGSPYWMTAYNSVLTRELISIMDSVGVPEPIQQYWFKIIALADLFVLGYKNYEILKWKSIMDVSLKEAGYVRR